MEFTEEELRARQIENRIYGDLTSNNYGNFSRPNLAILS
jgi:hypothetical protein